MYNGERYQGRDKFRLMMLANPTLFADVKAQVAEAIISLAPAAIPDEEISEEDTILADLSEAFGDGDDDDKDVGEPTDVVVEADDADDPTASAEAE